MVSNTQLESMTVPQLRALAEVRGVELPEGRLTKAQIVEALRAAAAARR
jgi:hypothetical protein